MRKALPEGQVEILQDSSCRELPVPDVSVLEETALHLVTAAEGCPRTVKAGNVEISAKKIEKNTLSHFPKIPIFLQVTQNKNLTRPQGLIFSMVGLKNDCINWLYPTLASFIKLRASCGSLTVDA